MLAVYGLCRYAGLSAGQGAFLIVAWVAKDLALYPLVKDGYGAEAPTGAMRLVGLTATARERLDPVGYVEVRGELWRARLIGRDDLVEPGERVSIVGATRLELRVERAGSAAIPREGE